MAEETILSWNAPNWITVLIMVFLGLALIGATVKVIQSRRAPAAA